MRSDVKITTTVKMPEKFKLVFSKEKNDSEQIPTYMFKYLPRTKSLFYMHDI